MIACIQEDWAGEFTELALADGHAVLAVDLPGHGSSRGGGEGSGSGSNLSSAAMPPSDDGDGDGVRCGRGWPRHWNLAPRPGGGDIGREKRDSEGRDGGGGGGAPLWGLGGISLAAEAVSAVCDAVGVGPYLTVGYSMGGRVALAMAGRRPDLMMMPQHRGMGGLVLVSSSPGLTR